MSFVHTAFGRGQIVGEETVRGRKQYLVAGNGFKLWVDETDAQIHTGAADFDFEPAEDVNEENSTDLPYNPEPQFPVEGFSDEQTIQPNHELDADDRLSPADSLTFDEVGTVSIPALLSISLLVVMLACRKTRTIQRLMTSSIGLGHGTIRRSTTLTIRTSAPSMPMRLAALLKRWKIWHACWKIRTSEVTMLVSSWRALAI